MKKNYLFAVAPILAVALTLWMFLGKRIEAPAVYPVAGVIDLSAWDPEKPVTLAGEWEFHDGSMIRDLKVPTLLQASSAMEEEGQGTAPKPVPPVYTRVPSEFPHADGRHFGVATYLLEVHGLNPRWTYAVQIVSEASAFRLTVNEVTVAFAGTVGKTAEEHRPEILHKIGYFTPDLRGVARFAMEISNFSYNRGGFWNAPMFGEAIAVSQMGMRQDALEIYLFAAFLTMGLFTLGLYGSSRSFVALLNFSFIAFAMALRTLLTNHRQVVDLFGPIPWDLSVRLEYLTSYILLPLYGLFFQSFEFTRRSRKLTFAFRVMAVAVTALVFLTPNGVYANFLPWYIKVSVVCLPYFLFLIFQGCRKKRPDAFAMLASSVPLIPTVLYDFYAEGTYSLLPAGTYMLLVGFGIVVAMRLLRLQQTFETLSVAIDIDPLTRIHNRRHLDSIVDKGVVISPEKRMFILFFDLDGFKRVNDTLGHKAGDAILVEAAIRLKSCFRSSDTLCRYGGDEFLAFAQVGQDGTGVRFIIERILARFREPFMLESGPVAVGVSVGASEYRAGESLAGAIRHADESMYMAKREKEAGIVLVEDKGPWEDQRS